MSSLSGQARPGSPPGWTCARKILKTIIVSEDIGGQATESWAIENYMGYQMVTGEIDEKVRGTGAEI